MAIRERLPGGWVVSHEDHIQETMSGLRVSAKAFFEVVTPFRMDQEAERLAKEFELRRGEGDDYEPRRKRKRGASSSKDRSAGLFSNEMKVIDDFLLEAKGLLGDPDQLAAEDVRRNNRPLRDLVSQLTDSALSIDLPQGRHFNDGVEAQAVEIGGAKFYFPAHSECIVGDARTALAEETRRFDLIVMDPPWENKHVKRDARRGKGYAMLSNDELGTLPVGRLLADSGLVAVWCTPSQRHQDAVREWFKAWDVSLVATWLWLKVTRFGQTVVDVDKAQHKQTFELILIGQRSPRSPRLDSAMRVVCSVPSGLHSHKPPLDRVLAEATGLDIQKAKCLEIFGRYLLPSWTTIGLQAMQLQHESFFQSK